MYQIWQALGSWGHRVLYASLFTGTLTTPFGITYTVASITLLIHSSAPQSREYMFLQTNSHLLLPS